MDGECTALARRALCGDRSPVGVGDVLDNGQSEARSPQFSASGPVDAVESLEYPREMLGCNATAGVSHMYDNTRCRFLRP